jgi:hypothetical protein
VSRAVLHADREGWVVIFQATEVCAPEEAGAVDGRVEGAVGESEVDLC